METQKIINLLDDSEESKFALKMVCYRQSDCKRYIQSK